MQIDLAKLPELLALLGSAPGPEQIHPAAHMIGKFVIIRSRYSGVHAGTLNSIEGRAATLTNARRLWYWKAASGHTLSGVALHGLDTKASKIAGKVSEICILDVCEVLPTTPAAGQSILGAPEHAPD